MAMPGGSPCDRSKLGDLDWSTQSVALVTVSGSEDATPQHSPWTSSRSSTERRRGEGLDDPRIVPKSAWGRGDQGGKVIDGASGCVRRKCPCVA